MKRSLKLGSTVLAAGLLSSMAFADSYGPFPITEKSYSGDKTDSVSYSGQVARNVLVESLKSLAGKGDGGGNAAELKAQMMAYFAGSEEDLPIIAVTDKDGFDIKQTTINEISSGKNVKGKTYKGLVPGWPGNLTGPEVLEDMITRASVSNGGFDADTGMVWGQLIQKFSLGAMGFNQVVDNYLDENLGADKKPNNQPYSEGAAYTGKEHSWDEAFGYFGVAAHGTSLTPDQAYNINKKKDGAAADANGDGVIDLKTEMVFGNAYYAAGADRSGKTDYMVTITTAFIEGRKLITSADGEALTDAQRQQLQAYAMVIETEWTKVLAEAAFKYAGSVYKDITTLRADDSDDDAEAYADYAKHWSELKGFTLALQTGRENLGGTAVRLNRLIGFSPVTMDETVVTGVDADGKFVKDAKMSWNAYQLNMLKVQDLLIKEFEVEARANDATEDLANLVKELDTDSGGAETD
ncbi:MAG: DUF4856 domain-containing protein [Litoreibacter sp.]|uniref:DUF4856 domain-containing protein n=1 Tax=Litoreibacter sp. TaxID=1969459 RepID=UPI003299FCCA